MKMVFSKFITTCLVVFCLVFSKNEGTAQSYNRVSFVAGTNNAFGEFEFRSRRRYISQNYKGWGAYLGGSAEFSGKRADSKFKAQVDLLYVHHSMEDSNFVIRLGFVNIPLTCKYFITPRLSFSLGASLGLNLISKQIDFNNNVKTQIGNIKFAQVGAVVGVSYYIFEHVFIDARYNHNFGNRLNDLLTGAKESTSFYYNSIQFGLGFSTSISNFVGRKFK